jgi:hypothetical protein
MTKRAVVFWVLVALLARILPQPRTVDDAFITFRYSRNLVEGNGFVYNPGDKVLGTTTPLYTAVMALAGLLGEDYPWYALAVNALADAAGVFLLFYLALELTRSRLTAGWIAGLWAVSAYSVTFAIGGMETSLHNLLMLAAWYSYFKKYPLWLGALCALGVLTRPDAVLWAIPLLLAQVWQSAAEKKLPYQTWLVGLMVVAPWLIFATVYFGSPIPQTIGAKDDVYRIPDTQAVFQFISLFGIPFQGPILPGNLQVAAGIIGIVVYPALALIGLRSQPRAAPIFIYPWLYALVFSLANPLIFRWYLVPPLPAYLMAIGCGVWALVSLLPDEKFRRAVLAGAAALTLAFSLNGWTFSPDHAPDTPAPRMAFHELEMNYEQMAKTLRQKYGVNENTILAAGDIGALGFYSRAFIFDTIGLVTEGNEGYYSPELMDKIVVEGSNYAVPPELILDHRPEFVVLMEDFIREGLLKDPRFTDQYEFIEFIPTDYYGDGMYAFQRKTS